MAKLYYKRIVAGLMIVNKVPSLWRNQVITMLEENGYTVNEDGTVTENVD